MKSTVSDTFALPPADAPFVTGTSAPPPPPSSPGWGAAATAIHSIQQIPRPILVTLSPAGSPAVVIDLRHQEYAWAAALEDFPVHPADVAVGTYPIEPDSPRLAGETRGVDALLWLIGVHAYPGNRASWLRVGDKYRLKWWPDLDTLPATPEQVRIIKASVKGMMTVEKLATVAKCDVEDAHSVINGLSLMGALRRLEGKGGSPTQPMPQGRYDLPDSQRGGRHVKRGG